MKGEYPISLRNYIVPLISVCIIPIGSGVWAQSTSFGLLSISPSPLLNGIGQVGTALPNDEAYGFYYNPAHLGLMSQENNAILQFYPAKTDWLPAFTYTDLTLSNTALNMGYRFENVWRELAVSVGLGYMYTIMNFGKNILVDEQGNLVGEVESWEQYHAFGLGVGLDYYATLSLGISYKSAKVHRGIPEIQVKAEMRGENQESDAFDYGIHLNVPLLKFYRDPILLQKTPDQQWLPNADVSIGYAKKNIGDAVVNYYSYIDNPLPLPRTARLGYSVSAGLDWYYNALWFELFKVEYSVDVVDLLVNETEDPGIQKGALGDINISKHLIGETGDEKVDVHRGFRLRFLDTFQWLTGSWDNKYWSTKVTTSGFVLTMKGIFRLLASDSESTFIQYLGRHFDVQYASSRLETEPDHPINGTEYVSLSVIYRNFGQ